jgi:hyperosmotically inducible periplasmic protein
MKTARLLVTLFTLLVIGALSGCSGTTQSPDVSDSIRKSLDQAGLKDVSVSQDRDKGVVTLSGHVPSDSDKSQAESIAKSIAGGQVVSNQIGVIPPAAESEAKTVNSDLDKGIDKNLDAALIQHGLNKGVKYDVKNGVVTLTGQVNSQAKRAQVEKVASAVPHVHQVVNELEVKGQKATSSH